MPVVGVLQAQEGKARVARLPGPHNSLELRPILLQGRHAEAPPAAGGRQAGTRRKKSQHGPGRGAAEAGQAGRRAPSPRASAGLAGQLLCGAFV